MEVDPRYKLFFAFISWHDINGENVSIGADKQYLAPSSFLENSPLSDKSA